MIDRYEELLRYRAGELSPEAARAVEAWPDLAERLAELDALDAQLQALPTAGGNLDQLVSRVRRPQPRERQRRWLGVAALGLAAAAVLALVLRPVPEDPWLLSPLGAGTQLDGHEAPRLPQRLGRTFRTRAGSGGAQLLSRRGWLGLSPGAEVSAGEALTLEAGAVAVEADALTLLVGSRLVTISGQAVVSAEPDEGSVRVTQTATSLSAGVTMKSQWMKLSSVALTAATVGGGLTVLVLDGHARIDEPKEAPIELRAGQQVSPATSRVPRPVQPPAPPSVAATEETVRVPADLAALERPQLVALVERLRDEKESLLTQRAALKQALASREKEESHPKRNFYRFEPEELLASAKLGEVRMRGPQVDGSALKLSPENASKLGLTPEEAAKVEAIYAASSTRVRDGFAKLYMEIGGDPSALSTLTIFEELRMKALPGEYEDAVRRLADARAGLPAAPGAAVGPTSAIGRAFALLDQEDQRTLTELEQLIGPARTEAMVNDEKNFPHHNHTFGVGPRKP